MSIIKQQQNRPSKGFTIALLGIVLCAQVVGTVVAINQGKWFVAYSLVVLAALSVMILRGMVRSRIS